MSLQEFKQWFDEVEYGNKPIPTIKDGAEYENYLDRWMLASGVYHEFTQRSDETINKQQAEIERLKGQRTELIRELKWTVEGLDDYYYDHAAEQVEATRALIAEIEASND